MHSYLFSSFLPLHNQGLDLSCTCVYVRRLDRCTHNFASFTPLHTKVLILLVLVCLSADWAGALILFNSSHPAFDLLLASFLRGCLVGLLSLGCTPFSLSVFGWCVGACVYRPLSNAFLCCLSATAIKKRVSLFWVATNLFVHLCELRHSGFSPLCPWQILGVVVFVGPGPVRFLFCFSAGWRSAYLAGGFAFRLLWLVFVFCLCF